MPPPFPITASTTRDGRSAFRVPFMRVSALAAAAVSLRQARGFSGFAAPALSLVPVTQQGRWPTGFPRGGIQSLSESMRYLKCISLVNQAAGLPPHIRLSSNGGNSMMLVTTTRLDSSASTMVRRETIASPNTNECAPETAFVLCVMVIVFSHRSGALNGCAFVQ